MPKQKPNIFLPAQKGKKSTIEDRSSSFRVIGITLEKVVIRTISFQTVVASI